MTWTSSSVLAAVQKFQGMSLQADSAANGGDVPPQITGDVASESVQLPHVSDAQEVIPEDFWNPVETTPCESTIWRLCADTACCPIRRMRWSLL